uniref:Ribosomal RNA processing protein 1 homolog n=1 Tax=Clastoptera arizonana TaxID=38151 RepID=A0A1B6CAA2_9HEMI
MGISKKSNRKIVLIAQEIELVRELASNSKIIRDKAVKKLKKWFTARSQGLHKFEKQDFLRIWKGLFYCMWMSDKPLIQEDLAEEISILVHNLCTVTTAITFIECGFKALAAEWLGIDDLRINKFLMLVRRIVRQSFVLIQKVNWNDEDVTYLADMYFGVLSQANTLGLKLHLIEIYCEELAKIGRESISTETVLTLITPFAKFMASSSDGRVVSHISRHIFLHLIYQSEAGIEYQEKFNAWKQLGFPGGSIDAIQKMDTEETDDFEDDENMIENDENTIEHSALDPRAGRVNVELPSLNFDPKSFSKMLTILKNNKDTTTKARKTIITLINKFEKLQEGTFPLGIKEVALPKKVPLKKEIISISKKILKSRPHLEKELPDDESDSESETEVITHSDKTNVKTKWNVTESKNEKVKDKENSSKKIKSKQRSTKRKINDVKTAKNETPSKKLKVKNNLNFEVSESPSVSNQKILNEEINNLTTKANRRNTNKKLKSTKSDIRGVNNHNKNETNKEKNDDWNSKLEEDETEIVIPSKKYLAKLAKRGGKAATSEFLKRYLGESGKKSHYSPKNKKVEFVLDLNKSQEHKEYRRSLKRNSDIPFDASTQPKRGVLKSTVASPINPFFEIDKSVT